MAAVEIDDSQTDTLMSNPRHNIRVKLVGKDANGETMVVAKTLLKYLEQCTTLWGMAEDFVDDTFDVENQELELPISALPQQFLDALDLEFEAAEREMQDVLDRMDETKFSAQERYAAAVETIVKFTKTTKYMSSIESSSFTYGMLQSKIQEHAIKDNQWIREEALQKLLRDTLQGVERDCGAIGRAMKCALYDEEVEPLPLQGKIMACYKEVKEFWENTLYMPPLEGPLLGQLEALAVSPTFQTPEDFSTALVACILQYVSDGVKAEVKQLESLLLQKLDALEPSAFELTHSRFDAAIEFITAYCKNSKFIVDIEKTATLYDLQDKSKESRPIRNICIITDITRSLADYSVMTDTAARAVIDYCEMTYNLPKLKLTSQIRAEQEEKEPFTIPEIDQKFRRSQDKTWCDKHTYSKTQNQTDTEPSLDGLTLEEKRASWRRLARIMRAANILDHRYLKEDVVARGLVQILVLCQSPEEVRFITGEPDDLTDEEKEEIAKEEEAINARW